MVLLAGCGNQHDKASGTGSKWKGYPYRIALGTQAPKPNPAGLAIPAINYQANPNALERRATLVVQFDASGAPKPGPAKDQMILHPFDIPGAAGALPDDYMNTADRDLAKLLGAYCMKGKVKINVALVRSSIAPQAKDAEIDAKRLSDWLPIEVEFKNPKPKC